MSQCLRLNVYESDTARQDFAKAYQFQRWRVNAAPRVNEFVRPFREPFITGHSRPVLADGLFLHVAPFDKDQEADVEMPNINCAKCTLQVIEFMAAHNRNKDGDYTYHHCAELQIRANPNKPIDTRFPAEK